MNIKQLNESIPIVDFLANEGIYPVKKHGEEWAYISPIRDDDRNPSFMVNIKKNLWHDHGGPAGGKLFDLVICLYPALDMSQLIRKLEDIFSFRQQNPGIQGGRASAPGTEQPPADEERKIKILSEGPILSLPLIHYLEQRGISLELAGAYCKEVKYELYGKKYYALGFKNDAGGYELRNLYFKGGSSPKAVTFIDNKKNQVAVFEGFFSFLSFMVLYGERENRQTNYLILNSLSFFNKSLPLMEKHQTINLYLDRDAAGRKCAGQALEISSRFKDDSYLYENYKDLNHYLTGNPSQKKEKIQAREGENEATMRRKTPMERLPPLDKDRGI